MSAYICNPETYNKVETFLDRHFDKYKYVFAKTVAKEVDSIVLNNVTQDRKTYIKWFVLSLIKQNFKSVAYRYNDKTKETNKQLKAYLLTYKSKTIPCDVVQFLKTLSCIEYQSSETKNWPKSKICKMIDEIRISSISLIPGYENAKWE